MVVNGGRVTTVSDAIAAARAYQCQGRYQEAETICWHVLHVDPACVEAWHLLGGIATQCGRLDLATEYCARAVQLRPDYAEAHSDLGTALQGQGRLDEAIACFERAIAIRPDDAALQFNLANALRLAGKVEQAVAGYRRSIEQRPTFVESHYNLGDALRVCGKLSEAADSFRRAIELRPDFSQAFSGLGVVLKEQGNIAEALKCYWQAIQLQPDNSHARVNLGAVLSEIGMHDEAETLFREALAIDPRHPEALYNLGCAALTKGHRDDARRIFDQTIAIQPDHAGAHFNRAVLQLLGGDVQNGWAEYEWRWQTGLMKPRQFRQPLWHGESLDGRTILLHAEQGFGDTFQFIRYAPIVMSLGASVVVECQKPLMNLLGACPGCNRLVGNGDELPPFDVHAPLASLPGIFKISLATIPNATPYVFASAALTDEWHKRLSHIEGFRVGVNWHGRSGRGLFRLRDIPPASLAPLVEVPAVRLISLQKGEALDGPSGGSVKPPMIDLGPDLDTAHGAFMDTAAIMMSLDLVITSDTAIAHLAGALGVPVWVALPFVPDWRWLLDRTDSPWYPTMRLFRQKTPGGWTGVFVEIKNALRELVEGRAKNSLS